MEIVTTALDGPVAVITYNRPEKRNSWNEEMHTAYLDALEGADRSPDVRAIVVTGAGDCFSAGADFRRLRNIADNGWTPYSDRRPAHFPLGLSTPTIAAVNGPAVGMGLVNAMFCDLRVASREAIFTAGFGRLGLVAEHGLSWLVPQAVGLSAANELLLTSRSMSAERAYQVGLVMQVEPTASDAVAAAVQLGHELAALSPRALAATKTQLIRHVATDFGSSMAETLVIMRRALEGEDFTEGLGALLAKRPVQFSGEGTDEYVADFRDHL